MPSGLTEGIGRGFTFEEFVWRCARGCGVFIEMRDDPLDAPIPEKLKPSSYHKDAIKEAEKEIRELEAMSDKEAAQKAREQYDRMTKKFETIVREKGELEAKYRAMLDQVDAWVPPSPDHVGFQEMMRRLINESIDFDCNIEYYTKLENAPVLESGVEWKARNLESAKEDLERHKREWQEGVERTESKNKWISQLRESLKGIECPNKN